MKHRREPIKNTCPDIDKVINAANRIIRLCNIKGEKTTEEYNDILSDIYNEAEDIDSLMEDLRSSNSTLRDWGIEEAERVDELEEELEKALTNETNNQ